MNPTDSSQPSDSPAVSGGPPEVPEKSSGPVPAPPGRLNIALALGAIGLQVGALVVASRLTGAWVLLPAVVFAFGILPLYSLVHEAEHRVFHAHPRTNEAFGVVLAAFFPASFTFLQACHLGHHRRNRSRAESFDFLCPGDRVWQKRMTFYALYLGFFWLTVPLATLLLLIHPRVLHSQLVQDAPSAAAMVNGIAPRYLRRIRLECLGVTLLHVGLAVWVGPTTWLLLYALGGLSWSSQQYIAHADSPLDVIHGAHNLRAHPWYAAWLLHFNWHLAHHQHPRVPWLYLPHYDDPSRMRPGYLTSFIKFWRGPVPLPPGVDAPSEARR